MTTTRQLALLGGKPAFPSDVPVGQMYFPSFERYAEAMRGIFDRRWYTNHGPLAVEAEERLAAALGVTDAICVTNATIGLMMAVKALGLSGRVILPAFTFIATAQALTWTGVEPVFCDVDLETHHATPELVEPLVDETVSAVLPVNLWGGVCDVGGFERLTEKRGVDLFFDSAQAFGCRTPVGVVGGFGRLEVFSFHATKVLGSAEGGCVATNDGELAARLRNIRSSYGAGRPVPVPVTANGRFSEAQAALTLMALDDFEDHCRHNEEIGRIYREGLTADLGLAVFDVPGVTKTNAQYVVCEVDADVFGAPRDVLWRALKAEGVNARRYFHPGVHRMYPYAEYFGYLSLPNTERLCGRVVQLPVGALVTRDIAERIVTLIGEIQAAAGELRDVVA